MDKKSFEKEISKYNKAKSEFLKEREQRDRNTHSENKTWKVDYGTGTLKEEE